MKVPKRGSAAWAALFSITLCPMMLPGAPLPLDVVPGEILVEFRGDAPAVGLAGVGGKSNGYARAGAFADRVDRLGLSAVRPVAASKAGGRGAIQRLAFDPASDMEALLKEVGQIPGVARVEPLLRGRPAFLPMDPLWAEQAPDYTPIGLPSAWDMQLGTSTVRVAIIDSGVEASHPDLFGALDLLASRNIAEGSSSIYDDLAHGTRVAGIVGAIANNGEGMAGVAFGTTLISYDVFSPDGTVTTADVISALDEAVAAGADIATLSLTFRGRSQMLEEACIDATEAGVLLVASAGNENQGDLPVYPASFPSVVGVGAVMEDGATRAPWSNFNGLQADLVNIVAPGSTIMATIPGSDYNGTYGSGTSYAVPVVAGVAALVKAANPDQPGDAIRAHLLDTATPLGDWAGAGVVNAAAAVSTAMVPDIIVDSVTVDDSPAYDADNDGDGILDAGESVKLVIGLRSEGAAATNVTATLSTASASIGPIAEPTAIYARIDHGRATDNANDPFASLVVAADAPAGGIAFDIALSDSGGPLGNRTVHLTVDTLFTAPMIIDTDMTWTKDKTWLIDEGCVVLEGATLTIEPGTTVRFADTTARDNKLEIRGGLVCDGTEAESIQFTSMDGKPGGGYALIAHMPVGDLPASVTIADADNDGDRDIVCSNRNSNDISLIRWNGEGFDEEVRMPVGGGAETVKVGDVDHDGDNDIVTANRITNDVSLIRWNGDGFDDEIRLPAGTEPWSVAIGDVDNNGLNDIVTSNRSSDNISFLQWNGEAFVHWDWIPTGDLPQYVVIADADNDGYDEIVTANGVSDDVSLIKWNGVGFDLQMRLPAGDYPTSVAIGDADNDGDNDIVVSTPRSDEISLIRWNGAGFDQAVWMPAGDGPNDVAIGDVDNDGDNDIITANLYSDTISMIRWNGQGFDNQVLFPAGDVPRFSVIGGTGTGDQIDIVVANGGSDNLTLMRWKPDAGGFGRHGGIWVRSTASSAQFSHIDLRFGSLSDDSTVAFYTDCFFERTGGYFSLSSPGGANALLRCIVRDNAGGDGILAGSKDLVECVAEGNNGTGLQGGNLVDCIARGNGAIGMTGSSADGCLAENNAGSGIVTTGSVTDCRATGNGGWGIQADGTVSGSNASFNANGIAGAELSSCTASGNTAIGLKPSGTALNCTAIGNGGVGLMGNSLTDCVIAGNGGGLTLTGTALRGYIAQNMGTAAISGGTMQSSVVVNNQGGGVSAPDGVDNSWVLGNAGVGIIGRGSPYTSVTKSAILLNGGVGVRSARQVNDSVLHDNAGYDYQETRPSTEIMNVDVTGNYWGEETTVFMNDHPFGPGTTGNVPSIYDLRDDLNLAQANYGGHLTTASGAGPDADAPAFLLSVSTNGADPLNIGEALFTLTFSESMDQAVAPSVTFGPAPPYSENVVAPDPGWVSANTWQGSYSIGFETGDGVHRLRVAGPVSLDGFAIPDDTAHTFVVDTSGARSANNAVVASIGVTETKRIGNPVGYVYFGIDGETSTGLTKDNLVAFRVYRWSLGNPVKTRIAEVPVPVADACTSCASLGTDECLLVLDQSIADAGFPPGELVFYQVMAATDCSAGSEVVWTSVDKVAAVYLPEFSITLPGCPPASYPYPQASVLPAAASVAAGGSVPVTLRLQNLGGAPYAWSLSGTEGWILPFIATGEVPAGSSADIQVTLSAASLPTSPTPYTGNLIIEGPGCSSLTIPISLTVTEPLPTPTPVDAERWVIN